MAAPTDPRAAGGRERNACSAYPEPRSKSSRDLSTGPCASSRVASGRPWRSSCVPARIGAPAARAASNPAPGYDTLAPRRFEFVPLWGLLVFFVYALRRVQCPALRRPGRGRALGRGQASAHHHLRLVLGPLGQTLELDGRRGELPHQLDPCVPLRGDGRGLGPRPPGPLRHHGHRLRRDPLAPRPPLPHRGLPDRRPLSAPPLGGGGAHGEDAPCASSAGSAGRGRPPCASSAATCGSPTSR